MTRTSNQLLMQRRYARFSKAFRLSMTIVLVNMRAAVRPIELIHLKRDHIKRLANQSGAGGEITVLASNPQYFKRPVGRPLQNILAALQETGITIRKTSFDAIALPEGVTVDFADPHSVRQNLPSMVFLEIKTANQPRVQDDFTGFFFAFTEGELLASEALGDRHRVILMNKVTGVLLETTVRELLDRAKSTNWQVSVQL